MTAPRLLVSHDLREFFRQELGKASACLHVSIPVAIEYYVVNLLSDCSRQSPERADIAREPLALSLERANQALPAERLVQLKALGDSALYMAGFFAESIERSMVDIEYYVAMGTVAYQGVASLLPARRRNEDGNLYHQLAEQFSAIVDLLNYVAAKSQGNSGRDTDLLKLYERYTRTRNERTRRILLDCGLSVAPLNGHEAVH